MGKKRRRRVEKKSIQNNIVKGDENTMALAIVKAYHIIENEKKGMEEKIDKKNKRINNINKEKWYIKLLFMLNIFIFPWKINKRFTINNKIYDGVLVLFVSLILSLIGLAMWVMGFVIIACKLKILQSKIMGVSAWPLTTGILLVMFGSLITLASKEFSKVSESNTIYAYSASIIALISCILTVISII